MADVCLFLLGIIIANVIEYSVHRYIFHGWGKKRKSMFAFHLREHHLIARRNKFLDNKVSVKEIFGLPALLIVLFPLYFLSSALYLGLAVYALLFFILHNIQHKFPNIAKKYFWWHWNHHMKNQNKSWNVVLPITDLVMGTLQKD